MQGTQKSAAPNLFKSRIIWLWKSDDLRRLKDGREKSLSLGLSGWWFEGMWSCGFLRATLMSFSSRGRGPSLRMASCSRRFSQKNLKINNKGHRKIDFFEPHLLQVIHLPRPRQGNRMDFHSSPDSFYRFSTFSMSFIRIHLCYAMLFPPLWRKLDASFHSQLFSSGTCTWAVLIHE